MFSKALLISSLTSVAFASVFVTAPIGSTTYPAGTDGALVSWIPGNSTPSLEQFGPSSIAIYVGNAKQQTSLQVLNSNVDVSKVSSITFNPNANIGPDSNEYFIRFQSISGVDSSQTPPIPYLAFSAKFTLTNMSGNFNASVQAEIAGQSTAPLASQSTSGTLGTATSTPSLTSSSSSKTGTSSTTSATAKASNAAMSVKSGWVGIVFGAVVGVTMF